ncbi:hypothetical protein GCM10010256_09020 [Streptomyces coeruleorubidus]|uniref:Uncharacterized protein n=1 Tax=Streptomyces coeruleorubidus TaxID=116188 RepID=A0A5J6I308_STRC4|nr:hypothetical protein CP976_13075 [Streptomyces coeruleorubidus]GGT54294.1 hypothetical protein GCM10010256_09020 [Streptomyces coeruleorubidus]
MAGAFEALLHGPGCRDSPITDDDAVAVAGCVTGDRLHEGIGGIGAALTTEPEIIFGGALRPHSHYEALAGVLRHPVRAS